MSETLLLVDGSNYLFRAFHALPDLRTSAGEPTGAIKGFTAMLGAVRSKVKPDFGVCVFDAKGKTFRSGIYPEYKANRPPMPEDLAAQIGPIHEFVRALGWRIIEKSGVEADDVIGTLATRAKAEGLTTYIATGDKDLNQLVEDGCVMTINTMTHEVLDEAGVKAKFGVPPGLIIDYLALMGDKVDNVPGIYKCGPKTAAKWLEAFGSLEAVAEHAPEVKGKAGEYLRQGLGFLPVAKDLVTIRTAVELPEVGTCRDLTFSEPDEAKLEPLFARWEMRSSVGRIRKQAAQAKKPSAPAGAQPDLFSALPASGPAPAGVLPQPPGLLEDPVDFSLVEDEASLKAMLGVLGAQEQSAIPVSVEILADSHQPMTAKLCGIALCAGGAGAWYMPLALGDGTRSKPQQDLLEGLRPWLEGGAPKVGHSVKFLLHVFANEGIRLSGRPGRGLEDTRLQDYVIESHNRHELPRLALRWLRRPIQGPEEVFGRGASEKRPWEVPREQAARYAVESAAAIRALYARFLLKMREEPAQKLESIYEDIELPTESVLFRMERTGTLIDPVRLEAQSRELAARIGELERRAWQEAGEEFNLSSPRQLGHILFEKLAIPAKKKTASGGYSTGEEVLSELAADYPLPRTVLEYRALAKLKSTYTDKLPAMIFPGDGRVHTTFGQATAVTGRLASSDPNLQNIPVRTEEGRRVREAFIAPAGCRIVSADYSQIELRIMAHLSGDPGLVSAFQRGMDVHRATASEVFGVPPEEVTPEQRRMAKVINFGLIYGMGAHGLAQNLGVDRAKAAEFISRYFARYPLVHEYMDRTRQLAHERGYVETAFGRRLWLPDIESTRAVVRAGAERQAINAPMQGTAADLIKIAMVSVQKWLDERALCSRLVLQVHDELVLEVPDEELGEVMKKLPLIMSGVATLRVPLTASVGSGESWEAAH